MTLPKLPKKKKRTEADKTPAIMEWFRNNYPGDVAVEVKVKGNKELPHQTAALKQVQEDVFAYKIRDTGKNPFDFFVLRDANAFTVTVDGKHCIAERKDGEEQFTFTI